MKIGDYITAQTLEDIGSEKYEELRSYLRFLGYTINPGMGSFFNTNIQNAPQTLIGKKELCVYLNEFSNLELARKSNCTGKEITYEEVMKMINLNPTII